MQPVPGTHQERVSPLSPPTLGLNFCEDGLSLSTPEITLRQGQGVSQPQTEHRSKLARQNLADTGGPWAPSLREITSSSF